MSDDKPKSYVLGKGRLYSVHPVTGEEKLLGPVSPATQEEIDALSPKPDPRRSVSVSMPVASAFTAMFKPIDQVAYQRYLFGLRMVFICGYNPQRLLADQRSVSKRFADAAMAALTEESKRALTLPYAEFVAMYAPLYPGASEGPIDYMGVTGNEYVTPVGDLRSKPIKSFPVMDYDGEAPSLMVPRERTHNWRTRRYAMPEPTTLNKLMEGTNQAAIAARVDKLVSEQIAAKDAYVEKLIGMDLGASKPFVTMSVQDNVSPVFEDIKTMMEEIAAKFAIPKHLLHEDRSGFYSASQSLFKMEMERRDAKYVLLQSFPLMVPAPAKWIASIVNIDPMWWPWGSKITRLLLSKDRRQVKRGRRLAVLFLDTRAATRRKFIITDYDRVEE